MKTDTQRTMSIILIQSDIHGTSHRFPQPQDCRGPGLGAVRVRKENKPCSKSEKVQTCSADGRDDKRFKQVENRGRGVRAGGHWPPSHPPPSPNPMDQGGQGWPVSNGIALHTVCLLQLDQFEFVSSRSSLPRFVCFKPK